MKKENRNQKSEESNGKFCPDCSTMDQIYTLKEF